MYVPMKFLPLMAAPNPKAFIDWVNEMNQFFDWHKLHKLPDDRKIRFTKLKLISQAKFFWLSIEAQRQQPAITDWIER